MSDPKAFDIGDIKLEEIVISDAVIENDTGMAKVPVDSYFNVSYSFLSGLNLNKKQIRTTFSCSVGAFDKEDNKLDIKGEFEILFYFKIEDIETKVKQKEESFQVDEVLLSELASIAYSSSRGIIYTKCQGTILKKVILPVLSSVDLIEPLRAQGD